MEAKNNTTKIGRERPIGSTKNENKIKIKQIKNKNNKEKIINK